MAKAAFQSYFTDTAGNVLEWPFTITVRREVAGSPIARIYSDRDGVVPRSNPWTVVEADGFEQGFARFFATGGAYRIDATKTGVATEPLRYFGIGTFAEADQGALNDPGYLFEFESETTAPPTAGFFRANNADISLATELHVSATTRGGFDVLQRLLELDPGSKSTKNTLIAAGSEITGATWLVDSVTDHTTYVTIAVSGHTGDSAFENDTYSLQREIAGGDGVHPGYHFTYSSSTAAADPGNGIFRLNNGTHASATAAYIDNVEALAGASVTAWLDSLDDSSATIKGELSIVANNDPAIWRSYSVTGSVVDSTGYRTVTIDYVAGAGNIADGTVCVFEFIPRGDDGLDGYTPGYRLTFDGASTAAGDPGAGKVRFNHATFASITEIYVDNLDAGGDSLTTWLDGLDDVANANARAYLRFQKVTDPTVYAEFAVTGAVTDSTGYRTIAVSPVAGAVPTDATTLVATASKSGADGGDPGILLLWDVANDDSDPGTGKIKADNDALGSATTLYIDKANRAGSDIEAFLLALDDSTNTDKGTLTLTDPATEAQAGWTVTGVTDATGYVKVAVSGHFGATSFADTTPLSLQFSPAGDKGADGGGVTTGKAIAMAIVFGG